jgi:hypothetical protein
MRRLAKAHQSRNIAHRDRRLLDQQPGGNVQATGEQILAESHLAELRVDPGELTRRARE